MPGQAAGVGITYYSNGMVKDVAHGNGVVDTQGNDPNGIPRPSSITAALGGATLWTTGAYQYDGAGNIWKIGTSWYEYDALSRLKTGAVFPGTTGAGTQQKQTYAFDDYGNLQSITTQLGAGTPAVRNTTSSTSTNRLTGAVNYDGAGNLTSWNSATYLYDSFNQMQHMTSGAEDWIYVYTADDERVWSYNLGLNLSRWTLRGLDGKVLRDFTNNNGAWSVAEDYLYRDGLLFAGYLGNGQRRHFALDHLGTVRLVTNTAGTQTDYHVYYPFGEEATPFDSNADRMQFTGHERDLNAQTGANPSADDLDYMHARHESPVTGRFLSVDSAINLKISPKAPQHWNRYAYALGNPAKMVDPDGREAMVFIVGAELGTLGSFGHSALYVTSAGKSAGISYGGDFTFDRGAGAFIRGYTSEGRKVTMYVLRTTPAQDGKMIDFLQKHRDGNVNRNAFGADLMIQQNCTTAVCNTLKAGGVIQPDDDANGALSGLAHLPSELKGALDRLFERPGWRGY